MCSSHSLWVSVFGAVGRFLLGGLDGEENGRTLRTYESIWLVVWNISYFPNWVSNHPNWLSYFSEVLKPPTRCLWIWGFNHQTCDRLGLVIKHFIPTTDNNMDLTDKNNERTWLCRMKIWEITHPINIISTLTSLVWLYIPVHGYIYIYDISLT